MISPADRRRFLLPDTVYRPGPGDTAPAGDAVSALVGQYGAWFVIVTSIKRCDRQVMHLRDH